jgi:hypothetical protein
MMARSLMGSVLQRYGFAVRLSERIERR